MIDELAKARVRAQTHPFQKIEDAQTGQHLGTGCMRCGMLLPPGFFLGLCLPACNPTPIQQP